MSFINLFLVLLLFLFVQSKSVIDNINADLTIMTTNGPVKGFSKNGADVWHAIPFARPPIGEFRFKPPQDPDPWTTTKDCFNPAPQCSQVDIANLFVQGQEDCLYLDVYRPAGATGPLPVLFWIYGGGYVAGDNYEGGNFDGTNRVTEFPVIIVATNYRLNAFGFLGLEELRKEDPDHTSGNYGVQDQRFALQWVQKNIAQFGGDPDQVTIFGESAGAFSVCYQLSSPASKGLFRAAIMESGTCDSKEFFVDFDLVDSWSADVASWAGCNRSILAHDDFMKCLRNTSEVVWMYTYLSWFTGSWDKSGTGYRPLLAPAMPWGPAIDGSDIGLPGLPLELIQQGRGSRVPLIAGTNSDEGTVFIPEMPLIVPGVTFPLGEDDLTLVLLHFFDNSTEDVNEILAHYPEENFKSIYDQSSIILRDYFFVCPTRRVHRAINSLGVQSWQYFFTYIYRDPVEYITVGDYHGVELPYVWNNFGSANKTTRDDQMQESMGVYWTNFARFLNPNGKIKGQVYWENYQSSKDNLLEMSTPCISDTNLFTDICDFWDTLYPTKR
eukprot:TRINITY_DN1221_c0_g1_i1.p1 TRINITY_DN1221_c0_g1~~TRINITY_DN1221_c0_g1_i1.p1  ORF type:complete len:565 (+),score=123.01 TRINITY_DN1221_c0_g1_i1:38-1696(+)